MGIEELDVESNELSERLLLISSDSKLVPTLSSLSKNRGYNIVIFGSITEANESESTDFFDLVMFDVRTEDPEIELADSITEIRSDFRRARAPLIVMKEKVSELETRDSGINLKYLAFDSEVSELIFLVSTLLRQKKVKNKQAGFESDVVQMNFRLRDLNNRFRKELKEAREIQQSILPSNLPVDEHCHFSASFTPLEAVGGDLYDIWRESEHNYGFLVADVVGHGLSAAMIGMMVKMAQTFSHSIIPNEFLELMNSGLEPRLQDGKFATALACFYDTQTRELSVSLAGHMPAMLWKAEEQGLTTVGLKGFPLGAIEDAKFRTESITLQPGDKFIVYTDGITEAQGMNGELWGDSGLSECFKEAASKMNITDCIKQIHKAQKEFSGGRIVKDDLTLVGMEVIK